MTKAEAREAARVAIVDATITRDGEEVLDYSECYLALVQELQGTLPEGYVIEWGPCSARNRRELIVAMQTDDELWEEATRGELRL